VVPVRWVCVGLGGCEAGGIRSPFQGATRFDARIHLFAAQRSGGIRAPVGFFAVHCQIGFCQELNRVRWPIISEAIAIPDAGVRRDLDGPETTYGSAMAA